MSTTTNFVGGSGRLQGRVAIIAGSSSGLGRAIAYRFALEGALCFLVDKYQNPRTTSNTTTGKADDWNNRTLAHEDIPNQPLGETEGMKRIKSRDHSTLGALAALVGSSRVHFHAADLTDEAMVKHAVHECAVRFGRIDILVNSHGISVESTHPRPLRCHETTLSDFIVTQNINTTSVFLTCKYALEHMVSSNYQEQIYPGGRGWIVNIASVQGLTPYYGTPSYCAAKGAVVMLSKQIALDYARDSIRCNAICPGFLNTDMTRNLQADTDKVKSVAERQPLNLKFPIEKSFSSHRAEYAPGGLGNVDDIASMVLVLASDDARWMTGQPVVVDGGYTLS